MFPDNDPDGEVRRCSKCIMPETMPGLSLDTNGICSYCADHTPPVNRGIDSLHLLTDDAKEKSELHDCVIGVSGGRDSSYVLWYAQEVLDLNVLAVEWDNEFRNKQADRNLEQARRRLDFDFLVMKPRSGLGIKTVRNRIRQGLSWSRKGQGALALLAADFCHPCMVGIGTASFSAAERYNVPLILGGQSTPEKAHYRITPYIARAGRIHRLKKLLDPHFLRDKYYQLLMRLDCPIPEESIFSRRWPSVSRHEAKKVGLFDFVPWDRRRIKNTIMKELGWRKPSEYVSTWRIDCELHHLVEYCHLASFGCTKSCMGYSNMIRNGQMTRKEALYQEEKKMEEISVFLPGLLREIGLKKGEREEILKWGLEIKSINP